MEFPIDWIWENKDERQYGFFRPYVTQVIYRYLDCGMSDISPHHWRTYVFPHMKDVSTELHRYGPDVKIYSHICGNILPIVEDLVEVGARLYRPP